MHCNSIFRKGVFFIAVPALLIAISALFFAACQKGNDNNLNNGDDQGGYASDASRIEWVTDDVISIADAAGQVYNGVFMGTCCTVGTDTFSNPHTLVIRFGSGDCTCADGRKRSGAIIVSYYGEYSDTNSLHTITFDNYFINDNQLTGHLTTNRVDTTIVGNWYYKVSVDDSLNMMPYPKNSQYVVWTGNLVRKWVTGFNPANSSDRYNQIFSISGAASLTRPNGHKFNFNIATPLQFALGCNYCESGVVNVSGYNGARVLNYGTGNCDPYAQLNIGVHVYHLTLTP